jgi:small subunit ribosomal protein S20
VANTESAKKRAIQSEKAYTRNRWFRGRARTYIKKARALMAAGDTAGAEEQVRWACRALDAAAQKGAIHANNAARRKSRLMKALHKLNAAA